MAPFFINRHLNELSSDRNHCCEQNNMAGTSTEDVFEEKPVEEETKAGTSKETEAEPTGEVTPVEKTELDSVKGELSETQVRLKRYKEQVSGSQEEAEKLRDKVKELEAKMPPAKEELPPDLSPQDLETRNYLKKLGVFTKSEVDKIIQEKIAPFQAEKVARARSEQRKVLENFIQAKPELGNEKDPDGLRMKQILSKLKRIAPADPFDPNSSLEEDLELAYKWAFGEEIQKEVLSKAEAKGRAEGHEAGEAKVGEGASAQTSTQKRQRTPEQETILREWGVDDESIKSK